MHKFKSFSHNMKALRLSIIIIFTLSFHAQAFHHEHHDLEWLFHHLMTVKWPEMDAALTFSLEKQTNNAPGTTLKKTTFEVYKEWHRRFSSIQNTSLPKNAALLHDILHPKGFQRHLDNPSIFANPIDDNLQRKDRVIIRLIQTIATACHTNPYLQPVLDELLALFECGGCGCMIEIGLESESTDVLMTPESEEKLQLYLSCLNSESQYANLHKTRLCDDLLNRPAR